MFLVGYVLLVTSLILKITPFNIALIDVLVSKSVNFHDFTLRAIQMIMVLIDVEVVFIVLTPEQKCSQQLSLTKTSLKTSNN